MIIGGSRACGKTTSLIKESYASKVPIVCASKDRALIVRNMAKEMKLEIPTPLSVSQFPYYGNKLNEVLVDDIEDVLSYFMRSRVKHATSSHKLRTVPFK